MNASLRWYYRNRHRVLARAAERAKLPDFNEKRRLYKARLRERLLPGAPGAQEAWQTKKNVTMT